MKITVQLSKYFAVLCILNCNSQNVISSDCSFIIWLPDYVPQFIKQYFLLLLMFKFYVLFKPKKFIPLCFIYLLHFVQVSINKTELWYTMTCILGMYMCFYEKRIIQRNVNKVTVFT